MTDHSRQFVPSSSGSGSVTGTFQLRNWAAPTVIDPTHTLYNKLTVEVIDSNAPAVGLSTVYVLEEEFGTSYDRTVTMSRVSSSTTQLYVIVRVIAVDDYVGTLHYGAAEAQYVDVTGGLTTVNW